MHACTLFNFNKHPIDIRDLHIFAGLVPLRKAIRNIPDEKDKKGMNIFTGHIFTGLIVHFLEIIQNFFSV